MSANYITENWISRVLQVLMLEVPLNRIKRTALLLISTAIATDIKSNKQGVVIINRVVAQLVE